jgi:hypothetical protein
MKIAPILTIAMVILFVVAMGCVKSTSPPTAPTTMPVTPSPPLTTPLVTVQVTIVEPPQPAPTLNALPLRGISVYGNQTSWATEATVYRVWINDTYQVFDPRETRYVTQAAPEGTKYLVLFVSMVNTGIARAPIVSSDLIYILYDNAVYSRDPAHSLPTKMEDTPANIIRIGEIEFSHKLHGNSEYTEDFGYSHGQKLGFIDPGMSNAVDGYIVYKVPVSLTPDQAYARIMFPGFNESIWKLG